jgi:predicted MPP superfamily phosphohydrolase
MGHHLLRPDLILFVLACLLVPVMTASSWIRRLLARRAGREVPRRRWLVIWTSLFAIELACVAWGRFVEPTWLEVTRHRHVLAGLGGGLRVVHLTDLHLDGSHEWEDEILAAVAAEEPDLVVLTGDYVNRRREIPRLRRFLHRLTGLAGGQRVFAVTGNFERDGGLDATFAEAGVPLLDGVLVTVTRGGAALQLAGIGDASPANEAALADLAAQVEPSVPALLLHHTPDLAESPGIEAFDLVLAGHTHGGQVRLPLYGALITMSRFGKRYEAGAYELEAGTRLYVSRGLGAEPVPGLKLRFLCRPEVAVFELAAGE